MSLYCVVCHYTVWCVTILCGVSLYCVVCHYTVWCVTILCGVSLYCVVCHYTVWCVTILCGVSLYCVVCHYTVWCVPFMLLGICCTCCSHECFLVYRKIIEEVSSVNIYDIYFPCINDQVNVEPRYRVRYNSLDAVLHILVDKGVSLRR